MDRWVTLWWVLLCVSLIHSLQGPAGASLAAEPVEFSTAAAGPPEGLNTWRVKQLKTYLADRGVECLACSEKHQLVHKVRESWQLPVLKASKGSAAGGNDGSRGQERRKEHDWSQDPQMEKLMEELSRNKDKQPPPPPRKDPEKEKNIKELLKTLQGSGLNFKVFDRDDLDKMRPEDLKDEL